MAVNQLRIWVPKLGNKYLLKLKINTLSTGLKKEIRKWKPLNCSCRVCKTFMVNLGFIEPIISQLVYLFVFVFV